LIQRFGNAEESAVWTLNVGFQLANQDGCEYICSVTDGHEFKIQSWNRFISPLLKNPTSPNLGKKI
jgi:hypothetical protein